MITSKVLRSSPWLGLTVMEYLCHKWPRISTTCCKHFPVLSSFMTYQRICNYINTTGATNQWNRICLPFLSSPLVFSGVRVTRSLVLCVCLLYRWLSFCPFIFGHCVVCSSSMYGFWLQLSYLQTLLAYLIATNVYRIMLMVNFIIFTAGYHSNGRFPHRIWISSAAWQKWQ